MTTSGRTILKDVNKARPCLICGGDSRCRRGDDGLLMCIRSKDLAPGFTCLGQSGDGLFGLYRPEGDPHLHNQRPSAARHHSIGVRTNGDGANGAHTNGTAYPAVNWEATAREFAEALTADLRAELASGLGLPEVALSSLPGLGWKADDPYGPCWTFPEVNAAGKIIGINRRYRDGSKMAMPGGSRGLIVPAGREKREGPIYCPEGASDVLALTAIGLAAIGRPNNVGGADQLAELLADAPKERSVIVLAEWDPKPDGRWPGRDGAVKVAGKLAAKLRCPVFWTLPPTGSKDVRAWALAQGPDPTIADAWNDLGERWHQLVKDTLQKADRPESSHATFTFDPIDSATFAQADYRLEWLVRPLLVRGQPPIIGGPKKAMKTSIVVDLALSIGTGTPFLGEFAVPQPLRVALLSGESGEHTLQETARRVAESKGIDLAAADVLWGFRLPQLANVDHVATLRDGIRSMGVQVLIVDPAYLCLLTGGGPGGPRAENMFDVGPLLLAIAQACLQAGATPVLIHHTKKGSGTDPLELDDLAYSGTAEFARQWLLINRREKYEPGSGQHRLWMHAGGSAGHGGLWSVDVEEGAIDENFRGRRWEVSVSTATKARQVEVAQREQAKREKQLADDRADDDAVLAALDRLDLDGKGAGYNQAQTEARLSDARMGRAFTRLKALAIIQDAKVSARIGNQAERLVRGFRRVPEGGS